MRGREEGLKRGITSRRAGLSPGDFRLGTSERNSPGECSRILVGRPRVSTASGKSVLIASSRATVHDGEFTMPSVM